MVAVRTHPTPTLDDARRAADALNQALDPGQVLLFGSVARGTQSRSSDLDLVLVFDDLGDYTTRRHLAMQAMRTVADAIGITSDVRVTDRPEWEIRTKQCRSTFEAHIAAHAVTLCSRPPKTAIDWDKEIGMAPTDEQQAADSLANTNHALNSLRNLLKPSVNESDALLAGNLRDADDLKRSRLLNVCAHAQATMETSLKALIHALKGTHPASVHSIDGLIDATRGQIDAASVAALEAALGPVSAEQASGWRQTSTYPADRRIPADPAAATPQFASQITRAATQMARTSISLIEQELRYRPAEAQLALDRCAQVDQDLPIHDAPSRRQPRDIGL